jgi:catechol 2,3-dioxygenase-like lactoylglutathione lyase family enzyme
MTHDEGVHLFRIVPQLTVADLLKSVEFYRDRLGFSVEVLDSPDAPVFASLEREDATLFLVSEGSREEPYQVEELAANKRGVGLRLYFEVEDARVTHDLLRAAGVTMLRELAHNEEEDYTEFSFADPDGYEIGIYS